MKEKNLAVEMLNVEGDSDGDPVEVVLGNKKLILFCFVLLVAMALIIFVI